MRLVVLANGSQILEVHAAAEALFIGSRDTCRICLPDAGIAAQQAVIYPESRDHWVVQQLAHQTVLRVNDAVIEDRTPLRHGDQIQLGEYCIRAYVDGEGASPAAPVHVPARPASAGGVEQMARFVQASLPSGAVIKRADEALTIPQSVLPRFGHVGFRAGSSATIEELMDVALQSLLETFAAHRAWIGVRRVNYGSMDYVEGRLLTGQSADLPELGDRMKPRVLDRGQFIVAPSGGEGHPVSALAGPLPGPEGPIGMVYLEAPESGRRYDTPDLDQFILLLNQIAVALDAIFREIAQNRAATINGEVSVAHAIQARLTPRKLPQWEALQFGAFRETGRERTGDIYDVVKLSNQMAAFMVAHTPSSGPIPSMLIAQAQSVFRAAAMHLDAPNIFLRTLNFLLYDGQDDHPQHCFAGVIDPGTGVLRYSVAGFAGAYVIGHRGEERQLGGEPTAALGTARSTQYALLTEQLESGETVALFTPGVTTARNRKGEIFGQDRFLSILGDGFGQLASIMLKEMLSDLQSFTQGGFQPDDITVLLAHRV
ncbi:MAG: SpoIIE family protein phosphatase [Phycisphaerae bacterium]